MTKGATRYIIITVRTQMREYEFLELFKKDFIGVHWDVFARLDSGAVRVWQKLFGY